MQIGHKIDYRQSGGINHVQVARTKVKEQRGPPHGGGESHSHPNKTKEKDTLVQRRQ